MNCFTFWLYYYCLHLSLSFHSAEVFRKSTERFGKLGKRDESAVNCFLSSIDSLFTALRGKKNAKSPKRKKARLNQQDCGLMNGRKKATAINPQQIDRQYNFRRRMLEVFFYNHFTCTIFTRKLKGWYL